MPWPSSSDYLGAIQAPKFCFEDQTLRLGKPKPGIWGLPKHISGNFAVVFQIDCGQSKWAVRCFTKQQDDRERRYDAISKFLQKTHLPFMVDFEYLKHGIFVNREWFPILKMEWIQGILLDEYISANLYDKTCLKNLLDSFVNIITTLKQLQIAHGDLQHRNIIIVNGNIRLIDYDGMFVPGLKGLPSRELGQSNYQSPLRTEKHFGPYLDNFSAWLIYLSLLTIIISPDIWNRNRDDNEFLIFQKTDFLNPDFSSTIHALETINDNTLKHVTELLKVFVNMDLVDIPAFDIQHLPTVPIVTVGGTFPGWLKISPTGLKLPWEDSIQVPLLTIPTFHSITQGSTPDWLYPQASSTTSPPISFNLITERIIFRGALAVFLLLNVTELILQINPFLLVIVGFIYSIICLIAAWLRYNIHPFVKQRRELDSKIQNDKRASEILKESVETKRNKLITTRQKLQSELDILPKRFQNSSDSAKHDYNSAKSNFDRMLEEINKDKQAINTSITEKRQRVIDRIRSERIKALLSTFKIADAEIKGIGDSLKRELSFYGIKTAADFRNVKTIASVSRYYGTTEKTNIILSNGQEVHVTGIGRKKGEALINWKHFKENTIGNSPSSPLPIEEDRKILMEIKEQLNQLDIKKAMASQEYERKIKGINDKCELEHGVIRANIKSFQISFTNETKEQLNNLENTQNQFKALEQTIKNNQINFKTLPKFSFGIFLKHISAFN